MTGRPISWPTRSRLTAGLAGGLRVALVFFPVYIGCATVTAARAAHWHPYASWELGLPFVPSMIVPYLSMFVLFVLPPLQLDEAELRALSARLIVASLLGGAAFLVLPAQMGFPTHDDAGRWQGIYSALYRIDGPFNTVPSFHVIYTASILLAMIEAATPAFRRVYLAWLVVVCASTVLTHRHHLLDVVSGLALAFATPALLRRPARRGLLLASAPTGRLQE
jgi:membrane-associated phospholipid phosphatase